eukprot:TRINITY_DN2420_c0_g1_i2.p1 TRINITY_DN2420_c0_g1~~TRINITY_DN2420_c0_g1_i2.p1  ORF type:complete len:466 (-),score=4.81 TRINITY_DN2420_c0_g1_i2:49-1446(-)
MVCKDLKTFLDSHFLQFGFNFYKRCPWFDEQLLDCIRSTSRIGVEIKYLRCHFQPGDPERDMVETAVNAVTTITKISLSSISSSPLRVLPLSLTDFAIKCFGTDHSHFSYLTNLTSLQFDCGTPLLSFPPRLKKLCAYNIHPLVQLPVSLTSLEITANMDLSLAGISHLSHLEMVKIHTLTDLVLPASVTSLSFFSASPEVRHLPSSIKTLDIQNQTLPGRFYEMLSHVNLQSLEVLTNDLRSSKLPRSLTKLYTKNSDDYWDRGFHNLPPNLKVLEINYRFGRDEDVEPRFARDDEEASFIQLPSALTSLTLRLNCKGDIAKLTDFPSSLLSLKLEDGSDDNAISTTVQIPRFPPQLATFTSGFTLSFSTIVHLPPISNCEFRSKCLNNILRSSGKRTRDESDDLKCAISLTKDKLSSWTKMLSTSSNRRDGYQVLALPRPLFKDKRRKSRRSKPQTKAQRTTD